MDDWVSNLYTHGQLAGAARRETERVVGQVLERSPVLLTIGNDMAEEFAARFGRPCFVAGNSVDVHLYAPKGREKPRSDAVVIRYVGGLHLGRDLVLAEVGEILSRAEPGSTAWRIEIFAPDADRGRALRLANTYPNVHYEGDLTPDRVPAALCSAGALLFVESGADNLFEFTRLSVSTKVPQYLASGRPILVLGPSRQSSVRALLRSSNSVYGGQSPAPGELVDSLTQLSRKTTSSDLEDVAQADWFVREFGHAATQERLRTGLVTATETWNRARTSRERLGASRSAVSLRIPAHELVPMAGRQDELENAVSGVVDLVLRGMSPNSAP